jgi:hypothetical protein
MAKELATRGEMVLLVQEANEHHNLAVNSARSALTHAKEAGLKILELKERCAHGTFTSLIQANNGLDMTMRTAQRYMEVARRYDDIIEKIGPSRAAVVSLSEGLAAIRGKAEEYFPPEEGPKTTRDALFEKLEPVDGTDECPKGGPHVYDEEACINCHDPKPAPTRVEQEVAAIGMEKELRRLFASIESQFVQLARQIDQLHTMQPYSEKEGISDALSTSYSAFKRWRSSQ